MASSAFHFGTSESQIVCHSQWSIKHSRNTLLSKASSKFCSVKRNYSIFDISLKLILIQVAVPVTGDQPANAYEIERVGFGLRVPFAELTEEKLLKAIQEVLNDPKYAAKAKEHGSLLTDNINNPLDKAVWWLEFILRHPGNKMRSPVHDLAWYQYFLIDVWVFVFGTLTLIVGIFYKMIAFCCCKRKKSEFPKTVKSKKKKTA